MELRSKDDRIVITLTDNVSTNAVYPQADFSMVDISIDPVETEAMFRQLYRTQRSNHVCLASFRLPKRLRLKAAANALKAEEAGFKYHDHITILSSEEYKSIPSNLTQLGETCVLFTKSDDVRKDSTSWFRPDVGDCSNVWDVGPQPGEFFAEKSISRHFCSEVGILLANASSPLVCRRFLVLGTPEPAMAEFAYTWNLHMHCISTDEISARRVIRQYQKYLEKTTEKDARK